MPKEIEVLWYGGQRGSWCHAIVEWLTEGFTHRMDVKEVQGDGAIVVIKADWDRDLNNLAKTITPLSWCLLIITANEDGGMGVTRDGDLLAIHVEDKVFIPRNCRVWLQTPHKHQTASRYIPWGWTPNCRVDAWPERTLDCSFAGQITHKRRWDMMSQFPKIAMSLKKWEFHGSDGFAKGISQAEYYGLMARSKVIPCPSGPLTVDSFRVCEALELGAVALLDAASPTGPYPEYWERVFGACPLSIIKDWNELPVLLEIWSGNWPSVNNIVRMWWAAWKESLKQNLHQDLHDLGAL
jgi:hypothetical protein